MQRMLLVVVSLSQLASSMTVLLAAGLLVVLLIELDEVVDVIARAEEDWTPLVYAVW